MKKVSMVAMGLLLAAAQVSAAEASDGTINFTGTIASQTCTVSVNGAGSTATVTLPKVAAGVLNTAGAVAGNTRFTLALSDCSATTGDVYAYFEQGAGVNANGRLTNTGTAKGVDLQLLDNNNKAINAGSSEQSTAPATVALTAGAGTLSYSAEYYATATAEAGTVASTVNYSINYL